MTIQRKERIVFGLGAFAGILLWFFADSLFGSGEPWDGNPILYLTILGTLGALLGAALDRKIWLPYLGLYAGQAFFGLITMLLHFSDGANFFLPLGVVFLALYTLPALVTAWVAMKLKASLFPQD